VLHVGPLPEAGELAERLCAFAGPTFSVALLATSDGDAFDNAIKLARGATGRHALLACPGPRRARSIGALSLRGGALPGAGALLAGCEIVPPDPLALERALHQLQPAALLVEPVDESLRPLGPSILKHMEILCKQAGVPLIVDETLTGLGRCGHRFAFQGAGVEPAAVVVGQALGGGVMAIAATVVRGDLHERAFGSDKTFDLHTATLAGSAAACEAALGLLDVIEREQLPRRAGQAGARLLAGLRARLGPGDRAEGAGLLVGVSRATERGAMLVAPPLDATDAELDALVARLTGVLRLAGG
jgi:acetylornithine/succinyldiaminopimelate/putrescine aminotransferase